MTCLLAPKIACSWRGAGGSCGRDTSATDCIMDSNGAVTPAQRPQRERDLRRHGERQRAASDATPKLTPRLDADLRENAGRLPAEHWTRSDLTAQETLLAWLESKVGVDGAAEAKALLAERPEEKDGRPETRGDRSGFERVWFWGNSRLSGDDRGQLETLLTRLADEDGSILLAGDQMTGVVQQIRELFEAENEVAPHVGDVLGMDSAAGVYNEACRRLGMDLPRGVSLGAAGQRTFRFAAAQRSQQSAAGASSGVFAGAFDSSRHPANTDMADAFPGYNRISRQG